jgi:hypothetical protein
MNLVWGILLFVFGSLLPGLAVAAVALDRTDRGMVLTVGTVLGVFVLPLLTFSVAILFGTYMSPWLFLAVGFVVVLGAVGFERVRSQRLGKAKSTSSEQE